MGACLAPVEVLVVRAVELVEAVQHVHARVAVHDVQHHEDAVAVRHVHQLFEFFGRAEAAARREEVGHVVAEAAVVDVLHHGHQLDRRVARFNDLRKHVDSEVLVAVHYTQFGTHTDVALVDTETDRRLWPRVDELVGHRGVPENTVVHYRGTRSRVGDPGWHTVLIVPFDAKAAFHSGAVFYWLPVLVVRDKNCPDPVFVTLANMLVALPIIEITELNRKY